MKSVLIKQLQEAIHALQEAKTLPKEISFELNLQQPRDRKHGDWACNIALLLAKTAKCSPMAMAEKLVAALPDCSDVNRIEIAKPGFINFYLVDSQLQSVVPTILRDKQHYGCSQFGKGKRIHIEFVSANPTGPLHVGHGRGAAFGACVVNLLRQVGYQVHSEYYVNDAGRQMHILALSVWLRYLQLLHEEIELPAKAYLGDYVKDIAQKILQEEGERFHHTAGSIANRLLRSQNTDADKFLDIYIETAQDILGEYFSFFLQTALDFILSDIQEDLAEFGVTFDNWFKESSLFTDNLIQKGVERLKQHSYVFEKEGALWFSATALGDEKDRVLIRKNGQPTYFASDVAYHLYKYQQNYHEIIDVFGADHHGYTPRIRAFLRGLNLDPEKLHVLLVQFAILYRGKEKVSMTTRGGDFVTLRTLRDEVGNDAARYFYIMRKPDQHLDFDLELAKSQRNENPVYYIQYAHARICSVFQKLNEQQLNWDISSGEAHLDSLVQPGEKNLLRTLVEYPAILEKAAINYQPHRLAYYLQELARLFHSYYNAERIITQEITLRNARLSLLMAVKIVLQNGLTLLGLSAPTKM